MWCADGRDGGLEGGVDAGLFGDSIQLHQQSLVALLSMPTLPCVLYAVVGLLTE